MADTNDASKPAEAGPIQRYQDPNDPFNGPEYRTGKPCIEKGCENPAGTYWSHLWCMPCNVARMDRISAAFDRLLSP